MSLQCGAQYIGAWPFLNPSFCRTKALGTSFESCASSEFHKHFLVILIYAILCLQDFSDQRCLPFLLALLNVAVEHVPKAATLFFLFSRVEDGLRTHEDWHAFAFVEVVAQFFGNPFGYLSYC